MYHLNAGDYAYILSIPVFLTIVSKLGWRQALCFYFSNKNKNQIFGSIYLTCTYIYVYIYMGHLLPIKTHQNQHNMPRVGVRYIRFDARRQCGQQRKLRNREHDPFARVHFTISKSISSRAVAYIADLFCFRQVNFRIGIREANSFGKGNIRRDINRRLEEIKVRNDFIYFIQKINPGNTGKHISELAMNYTYLRGGEPVMQDEVIFDPQKHGFVIKCVALDNVIGETYTLTIGGTIDIDSNDDVYLDVETIKHKNSSSGVSEILYQLQENLD